MKCLLCKGKGHIPDPENRWESSANTTMAVKRLRAEGYSYSEVAKLLGMKSKHHVAYHAKK